MKKNNLYQIMRNLSLVTQVGLSILTPLFLCVFAGQWVDRRFHTESILFFMLLGLVAGIWSTVKMFQKILANDAKATEESRDEDGKKNRESGSGEDGKPVSVSVPKRKSRVYCESEEDDDDKGAEKYRSGDDIRNHSV